MAKMTSITQDKLKSGMILERRDGKKFLLFKDIFPERNNVNRAICMDNSKTFIRMVDYSDNLCFLSQKREYDIVKVWLPTHLEQIFADSPTVAEVIWERSKEKYTYEQLKAIVGHDFDFVG